MKEYKKIKTFEAKIWVGFKERYSGKIHGLHELRNICQKYVDDVKFYVTINPTEFIYTDGNEPGAWIGLIQYPRFIITEDDIKSKAIELGEKIMVAFNQYRVTIVTSDGSYMISNEKIIDE